MFDLEQGSIGNQFSNLYSDGVQLEYPHRNDSGAEHDWLTAPDPPFLPFGEAPVVGALLILWCDMKLSVAQLCPTLCDPIDCSLPGSSVRGILQARILEWVVISFSRGFQPRDGIWISYIAGRFFTI